MPSASDRRSLLVIFSVITFIVTATIVISIFARGYRINLTKTTLIESTGLLSATSRPKSASVYLNERLTTATDDTLNLPPGEYSVKIVKDGYHPWEKVVTIKKEFVYLTDAQLYRSAPDLKPITLSGAVNPTVSPDLSKIIYAVASASASRDNGLYQIDLFNNFLPLSRNSPKQIAPNLPGIDWSKFNFQFSPNSKSFLATSRSVSYLINLDSPINPNQLFDTTPRLPIIEKEWQQQHDSLLQAKLERLPEAVKNLVASQSASLVSFSSSEEKILYPHQNTYYVYDIIEKKTHEIGQISSLNNPFWLPNSNSIIYTENNEIKVIDFDGTNHLTIFRANQINPNLVLPWSDGSRIITLLSPYSGAPLNLYGITIR